MCGGSTPAPVRSDPQADADRIAAQAAVLANTNAAQRRRSRRASSLISSQAPTLGESVIAGKSILGG